MIKQSISTFSKILDALPEIVYVGNPILRTKTKRVSIRKGIQIGKQLGKSLLRYRSIAGYGRGLAAPQIGVAQSVFVTYLDNIVHTYINPVIVDRSKKYNYFKELCLSAGIFSADVKRPEWIVMKWTDENAVVHQERFDGFLARLYQHEEAHLRGVVHLDQAEPGTIEFTSTNPLLEKLRTKKT
jgi:peptide deformylase